MNGFKRFFERHNRGIGNLADYLGIGSAVAALAGWASGLSASWMWPAVAATALVALALAATRIRFLSHRIAKDGKAFADLLHITHGLFIADVRDQTAAMERSGIIPITEMAAFFQTLRHVRQEAGASPDDLREIDQAMAQLAEYERRVRNL